MARPVPEKTYAKVSSSFVHWLESTHRDYLRVFESEILHISISIKMETVHVNKKRVECLTIKLVKVAEEWRRKGFFKTMLEIIESICSKEKWIVYFDAVRNEHLRSYLMRIGYCEDAGCDENLWYIPMKSRNLFD